MKTSISSQSRRRMAAGISAKIRELEKLRGQLPYVDKPVLDAGMDLFDSEAVLALWLCEPARALGGKIPLRVMHTAKGRQQVVDILRALAHGIYL